jgi:hypothetical protein
MISIAVVAAVAATGIAAMEKGSTESRLEKPRKVPD